MVFENVDKITIPYLEVWMGLGMTMSGYTWDPWDSHGNENWNGNIVHNGNAANDGDGMTLSLAKLVKFFFLFFFNICFWFYIPVNKDYHFSKCFLIPVASFRIFYFLCT